MYTHFKMYLNLKTFTSFNVSAFLVKTACIAQAGTSKTTTPVKPQPKARKKYIKI